MNQKYRLSPSTIASYFKHRCDRLYRWESVERPDRGRPGIGWNVPSQPGYHSRPGIALLTTGGDIFEIDQLAALQQEHGPGQLLHYGLEKKDNREFVRPWPMAELAHTLRQPAPPRFCAQIHIDLPALPGGSRVATRIADDAACVPTRAPRSRNTAADMASTTTTAICHGPEPICAISRSPSPTPTTTPSTSSIPRRTRLPMPVPSAMAAAMGAKNGAGWPRP